MAEKLHVQRSSHKNKGRVKYLARYDFERFWWKIQIWWSEYCRLKATGFSVAQQGIVQGCKVTGSQLIPHTLLNRSPVFISLTYSCVSQKEEKQISGFSSILVLDFHQRTPAAGAQGPCLYLFIFIYWNELHFSSVKGNSLNTTSVCTHSFSSILKHCWKKVAFLFKNPAGLQFIESATYKQLGNWHAFYNKI